MRQICEALASNIGQHDRSKGAEDTTLNAVIHFPRSSRGKDRHSLLIAGRVHLPAPPRTTNEMRMKQRVNRPGGISDLEQGPGRMGFYTNVQTVGFWLAEHPSGIQDSELTQLRKCQRIEGALYERTRLRVGSGWRAKCVRLVDGTTDEYVQPEQRHRAFAVKSAVFFEYTYVLKQAGDSIRDSNRNEGMLR